MHNHDIYLPSVIPPTRQAEVNYELGCHFASLLGIENAGAGLLSLLMSAPINQLTSILQRHNIEPPPGGEISSREVDYIMGFTDFPAHYPEDVDSGQRIGTKSSDISVLALPIRPRVGSGLGSLIEPPFTATLISPAVELRRKEIGFRGELYVSTPFLFGDVPFPRCFSNLNLPAYRSIVGLDATSATGPSRIGRANYAPRPVIPSLRKVRETSAISPTAIPQGTCRRCSTCGG